MSGHSQSPPDGSVQPTLSICPYGLYVSIGGYFEHRYPLRWDKATWAGRRPHGSNADHDYIQIPGSMVRWHCLFEWEAKEERFWVTTGGRASVWINEEDVGPKQRRLLNDGDVVIVSGEKRGPRCVRLTLVRSEA